MTFIKTTIDQFYALAGNTGENSMENHLTDPCPGNPPPEPANGVFTEWKIRCLERWKSSGNLFFTHTINSRTMYNKRLLCNEAPDKQAKHYKLLIKQFMLAYEQTIKVPTHYYIFFEYSRAGALHSHGIMYTDADVIFCYPYYICQFKKLLKAHTFNTLGCHCESVLSFADVAKYISKDSFKSPISAIYS